MSRISGLRNGLSELLASLSLAVLPVLILLQWWGYSPLLRAQYAGVASWLLEVAGIIVASLIFFTAYGSREIARSLGIFIAGLAMLVTAVFELLYHVSPANLLDPLATQASTNIRELLWFCAQLSTMAAMAAYLLWKNTPSLRLPWFRLIIAGLTLLCLLSWWILTQAPALPPLASGLLVGLYLLVGLALYRRIVQEGEARRLLLTLSLLLASALLTLPLMQAYLPGEWLMGGYKVLAYYLLYRAIFINTVCHPYEQIQKMLSFDDLTGLLSRTAFKEDLQAYISSRKTSNCLIIMFGLDHFRTVNATLGHERGDLLLVAVAARLKAITPPSASVARLSGDHFIILYPHSGIAAAQLLGQRLLEAMQEEFDLGSDKIEISASIGIAAYPEDGSSASVLLRHVDMALNQAKCQGRQCQVLFSQQLSDKVIRRALLESRLKHAIENRELSLYYQPKIDIGTNAICGWEALMRWHSPELGQVSPVEFIPVAEESGLIMSMGEWAIQTACEQICSWHQKGLAPTNIAVNLSTRQFRQKKLPDTICRILSSTGVSAFDLSLEITESAIMDDPAAVSAMLGKLVGQGICTAVDDFGTGHSSLSYLKDFPIHSLKIDRSFICDIPQDESALAIVHAILSLAHSLGLTVVAEGVENSLQAEFLKGEGCDEIQGFWFSPPLPADQCEALMSDNIAPAWLPEIQRTGLQQNVWGCAKVSN